MKNISKKIIQWLVEYGVIQKEDAELYEYAVFTVYILIFTLGVSIIIGGIMGHVVESIVFIITFMIFRKFCGGYHAKHIQSCLMLSVIMIAISVYMICMMIDLSIMVVGITLSLISIFVFSPVDSENYRLNEIEKQDFHRVVVILIFICIVVESTLLATKEIRYFYSIGFGVVTTAILQLIQAARNILCND